MPHKKNGKGKMFILKKYFLRDGFRMVTGLNSVQGRYKIPRCICIPAGH